MSCPDLLESRSGRQTTREVSCRAMATDVRIGLPERAPSGPGTDAALEDALEVFHDVERACTRFDPDSPLMRANRAPDRFHAVPVALYEALRTAAQAHAATRGGFDPRILEDLVALGYDRTLPFGHGEVTVSKARSPKARRPLGPWRPSFRGATREVRLGRHPVDLGGIGKGLAIRWASELLRRRGVADHVVSAGGDCQLAGTADGSSPWHVGVDDPFGGPFVAVLGLRGMACATSSSRLRSWELGGGRVHHLIDPRNGLPGGRGLASVTVVGPEADWSEVWSKTLLLAGAAAIGRLAEKRSIAALWVGTSGSISTSRAMARHLVWSR